MALAGLEPACAGAVPTTPPRERLFSCYFRLLLLVPTCPAVRGPGGVQRATVRAQPTIGYAERVNIEHRDERHSVPPSVPGPG
jgi:hypothetical protein